MVMSMVGNVIIHRRTCRRRRKRGNITKDCTENRIRAKTEMSLCKRDARTTEDEMAAFMDSTDVNLQMKSQLRRHTHQD